MRILGVIPARYDSKRFPGKVLAELNGKTILEHVYRKAVESSIFESVLIATDDKRIKKVGEGIGAAVIMTPKNCLNGSERSAKAAVNIDCDIVVNIQADQPILPKEVLRETIGLLIEEPDVQVSTPIFPILNRKSLDNSDIVKVIVDNEGFALYFSRSVIPYVRNDPKHTCLFYKHIGIYAYRKQFILKYVELGPSLLEKIESLEQLRILENGYKVKTVVVTKDSPSIDTKLDMEQLNRMGSIS